MTDLLERLIESREMIQPNHANNFEVAHGGNVMKWMDEVGPTSTIRFAGEACVTARVDQMNFERLSRPGTPRSSTPMSTTPVPRA